MSTPTGRRLQMLAILQSNPGISAGRLADRLDVTERTARRDVEHLRDLGYRIDAEPGRFGGYTLAAGSMTPPLVLDADEALAVALGLHGSVGVGGLAPAAVTALAKLTETIPSRLRGRFEAVAAAEALEGGEMVSADAGVLVTLALACRSAEAVRFRHRRRSDHRGEARDVQPLSLVRASGRWYLVGNERGSQQWLTYALDRISDVRPLGTRFTAPPPPPDAAAFVADTFAHGWRHSIRVRLYMAGDEARRIVRPVVGSITDDGDDCILTLGADDLDWAARWLIYQNFDFDVLEPTALNDRLHSLGTWIANRYRESSGLESGTDGGEPLT
ncbi:helix-turn-helix transcriptional regulator [Williamsia muralis]|uniref:DNA-binding protein n=1 Tax=Williamsia marianensis TaxID=85044 RepID=A0A2G3PLM2_WILMA|nr:WYL domain-containing protein [Williamsia marianensis]PHV66666.1 DNA-binding protein [Williamsia marianensis]